jgi:hypothetical protein
MLMPPLAALLIVLLLWCVGARAETEVIALQNRPTGEIVPALLPHLEPGGSISSIGNQLVISASPAGLARIKDILAIIDRPSRQLLISVRQEGAEEAEDRGGSLSGRIGTDKAKVILPPTPSGPGVTVQAEKGDSVLRGRIWGTREVQDERAAQQVRVLEGGTAFIHMGVSIPLALRQAFLGPGGAVVSESIVFMDLGTGFLARPTLSGDTVTLEIRPQQESLMPGPGGVARVQRLSTTVSGRLGEWIPLGGGDIATAGERSGYVTHSTQDLRRRGRILLKVEEAQ